MALGITYEPLHGGRVRRSVRLCFDPCPAPQEREKEDRKRRSSPPKVACVQAESLPRKVDAAGLKAVRRVARHSIRAQLPLQFVDCAAANYFPNCSIIVFACSCPGRCLSSSSSTARAFSVAS